MPKPARLTKMGQTVPMRRSSNMFDLELVAAVRFFSLCDSAGKGHVTEVELRRFLRALNGGERGTDDVRFDAAFLSRDLMHQMGSAVDGKIYLHEFLQHDICTVPIMPSQATPLV